MGRGSGYIQNERHYSISPVFSWLVGVVGFSPRFVELDWNCQLSGPTRNVTMTPRRRRWS